MQIKTITESALRTDVSELAHNLVRELAMTCKKASIYGNGHPVVDKALGKPFDVLMKLFAFRKSVHFNLRDGNLYVLNIRLRDSVFVTDVVRFMELLDVRGFLFSEDISRVEFGRFIDRFVTRVDLSDRDNLLYLFLEKSNIQSVEVNSDRVFSLFESHRIYRADVDKDYSVRSLVMQEIGSDIERLGEMHQDCQRALQEYKIEYHADIVTYLLPEKLAEIKADDFYDAVAEIAGQVKQDKENSGEAKSSARRCQAVIRLVDFRADRETIMERLVSIFGGKLPDTMSGDLASTDSANIPADFTDQIDGEFQQVFNCNNKEFNSEPFADVFQRLLKTGRWGKADDILCRLMNRLGSSDPVDRQRALVTLVECIESFTLHGDLKLFIGLVERVAKEIETETLPFEYSEFIWQLIDRARKGSRVEQFAVLVKAMATTRKYIDKVTIYESIAVKKAFDQINRPDVIQLLVNELVVGKPGTTNHVREILVGIASQQVAMALSQVIAHPNRQVRQQSLRILSELGHASLVVFSRILMDDEMFRREGGRHELPDSQWYVVRNSIFVIGSLQDSSGIPPLRLRITDTDVRIKREIISALEKIGGDEAADLLIMMAVDPVKEIREAAVIAVGLIGTPEIAPVLVDLVGANPAVAVQAIHALGRVGGPEAQAFLESLLNDEAIISNLTQGQISRDKIRLATVKALGSIGDETALDRIKEFRDNQSTTHKIFFKNSPVNKAITDILSKY